MNGPSFDEIPSSNFLPPVNTNKRCSDVSTTETYYCNVLTSHNSIQERVKLLQAAMGHPTKLP